MGDASLGFLTSQISRLPLLAIYVIAMAMAFRRRRALGGTWWFTVAGCSFCLLAWLASTVFFGWLTVVNDGASSGQISLLAGLFGHLSTLVDTVGTAFVLAAALRLFQPPGAVEPAAG